MILLPATTIAGAVANQLSQVVDMGGKTPKQIAAVAKFLYGSGGTTVKAWLQTSFDGVTFYDVFSFAFTTAAANKLSSTSPTATAQTPALTDAALADNTNIVGLIGRYWRVKYTTTGTYGGATSLEVDIFGTN
jgi:hypothetical protein